MRLNVIDLFIGFWDYPLGIELVLNVLPIPSRIDWTPVKIMSIGHAFKL